MVPGSDGQGKPNKMFLSAYLHNRTCTIYCWFGAGFIAGVGFT